MFVIPASLPSSRRAASDLSRLRFLDALFAEPGQAGRSVRQPALDVAEDETSYQLRFEVPGVQKEQLKVAVLGRRVTLETLSSEAAADEPLSYLYRERAAPVYARTVSLPTEVEAADAHARYENGILSLSLRKKLAPAATQLNIS